MTERIKELYQEAKSKEINHNHYVIVYVLFSFVVAAVGILFDANHAVDILAYIQIWGIKLLNGGLFLGSYFSLIYTLRGTRFDVLREIFEEHNTSVGIWLGLLALALALVFTINS